MKRGASNCNFLVYFLQLSNSCGKHRQCIHSPGTAYSKHSVDLSVIVAMHILQTSEILSAKFTVILHSCQGQMEAAERTAFFINCCARRLFQIQISCFLDCKIFAMKTRVLFNEDAPLECDEAITLDINKFA